MSNRAGERQGGTGCPGQPPQRIRLPDLLRELPAERRDDPRPAIRSALARAGEKVVVLDDDPTGTQTVWGVPVLADWSVPTLRSELINDLPAVYILTNSRSLSAPESHALTQEIGRNLIAAGEQAGRRFVVISRGDSTLRGHYPGEVDALVGALGDVFDALFIIPFFAEGGRYTAHDVHYVLQGDTLIPVAETEFARDATFGYASSNLREWVCEKTAGRIPAGEVRSVSLQLIRRGGPEAITEHLMGLPRGSVCIVNAVSYRDLEVFTQGLLAAEARGRRYLYRTAAAFAQVRAGIAPRSLLDPGDLHLPATNGGLVIVGSHVSRTTQQVQALLAQGHLAHCQIDSEALLQEGCRRQEVQRVASMATEALGRGEDVLLFTSRQVVLGADREASLRISQQVSRGLVEVVRSIPLRPRYVLAKGGITSSDTAVKALGMTRAMVSGQILPGVPVWELGLESRFPGLVYIVFPGNVGGPSALADIVRRLAKAR